MKTFLFVSSHAVMTDRIPNKQIASSSIHFWLFGGANSKQLPFLDDDVDDLGHIRSSL